MRNALPLPIGVMTVSRGQKPRRCGFTIVEAIATMVVLGTIAAATSGLVLRAAEAYQGAATDGEVYGDLAAAMDRIERELRAIPGKGGGAANLNGVTPASISWSNGGAACSLSVSGDSLLLVSDSSGAMTLLKGVAALEVQTFDESNAALPGTISGNGLDSVRRVSVRVTAVRNGRSATLRSKVFFRCCAEGAN